ncbi:1-phosphofructokinase family hexose kinase [Chryseobacterium gotjawalense]|uniref:1-phosphofructokinase family hexose kinase n=1 Tax=Chryseobacterium gotjawalense TaxID=3042315 RepID=A0ABY8RFP4_9FLAO|nr:1-phosphofructokinase family hexose kinase [Chryseobacterium sp. wdc7]WHF52796.1 1-phosphofructokinase family hexose kinase [Chryseobacterium sp. wdc7]
MKKSVLTITLNPSIDKSSSVQNIVPGLKLRCKPPKHEAGGGGINVSRALARLGISSDVFFTSGGRTGQLLEEILQAEKLHTFPLDISTETRENITVMDTFSKEQYRFIFPGGKLTLKEQKKITDFVDRINPCPDFVVFSGSLPPGVDPVFLRQLVDKCKAKGSNVIVDTSGEALKIAIEAGVFLIKPSVRELSAFVGKEKLEDREIEHAAQLIISQGKAKIVVVSLGSKGAVLFSENEKIQVAAPAVKVKSTVGAGDSMVAGMLSVLINGGDHKKMISMGIACGSAATMAEGTGLFTKENAERIFNDIQNHK